MIVSRNRSVDITSDKFTSPEQGRLTIGAYGFEGWSYGIDQYDQYYSGLIDELQIYSVPLTPEQVEISYMYTGIRGLWDFEVPCSPYIFDKSPFRHLTLPIGQPTLEDGIVGSKSMVFNGTTDFLRTSGRLAGLDFAPGSFSVSVWINRKSPDSIRPWRTILEYDRYGSNWFGLWLYNEDKCHFRVGTSLLYSSKILNLNTWYHVCATYDCPTKRMTLYIDGQYDSSAVQSQGFTAPFQSSLTIGAYGYEGLDPKLDIYDQYFTGAMDHLLIFSRALTEGEIQYFYDERLK
jgi:hypothetical protein